MMNNNSIYRILVINPGSTSTKLSLYENENPVWAETITYSSERLEPFKKIIDQFDMRKQDIEQILEQKMTNVHSLNAIAVRGGPFKPLAGGTYKVTQKVQEDVLNGRVLAEHISNLGVLIAHELVSCSDIPVYFVDPISVDEMIPVARISGIPELERISLIHALNIKATVRTFANDHGWAIKNINVIVAHLGGGFSICAIQKGRILDVNNANEEGPFSPERAGTLPICSFAKMCYSGQYSYKEMKYRIVGRGGMVAYLGTSDAREVEKRIAEGDQKARLVYEAMAYQIAKEIGAMAAVLKGKVDAILISGGLAHSKMITDWIQERVAFIAPVSIYPGEKEMEALAFGVLRVLRGEEKVKYY